MTASPLPTLPPSAPTRPPSGARTLSAAVHALVQDWALDTPFMVVEVDVVRARYREVAALFPGAAIQYAVKANPHPRVLSALRSLVADAGVLEAEVLLVARKSRLDPLRGVDLDIGRFGGLAETTDECIHDALECSRGGRTGPVVLAGPTCDSADVVYERRHCELPLDLAAGDRVRFHSAGAYTSTYASVGFNGFAPLRTHVVEGRP